MSNVVALAARTALAFVPIRQLRWLVLGGTAAACLAGAIELRDEAPLAAQRALQAGCLGMALPLATLVLCGQAWTASVLRTLGDLGRFGADRRWAFLGAQSTWLAGGAVWGAWLALCTAGAAHGTFFDWLSAAGMGALGGMSYGAWFALASTFRKPTRARVWALFTDWILGFGTGGLSLLLPRGHLRSLAGGSAMDGLSRTQSAAGLCLLTCAYLAFSWRRIAR